MSIEITAKVSRNGLKKWYYYEWGKGPGERRSAGIFTYTKPREVIQKNHNKEVLALLETKKSQMVIAGKSRISLFPSQPNGLTPPRRNLSPTP